LLNPTIINANKTDYRVVKIQTVPKETTKDETSTYYNQSKNRPRMAYSKRKLMFTL